MIVSKKKLCSVCGEYKILWKSFPPTCNSCKSKTPIKKVSDKHKEILKEYKVVKAELIAEKLKQGITSCEIKSPVCKHTIDEIHHSFGKSSKELYLNKDYFFLTCRACHSYIHENSEWSYIKGFTLHKNQINENK